MKYRLSYRKGDISILISILISSILLILLTALAQKLRVDTTISRETLMSQQAIQAARSAVGAWEYYRLNGQISIVDLNSPNINWPNENSAQSIGLANLTPDKQWVIMDTANAATIQYRAEFKSGNPAYIVGIGRVILSNGVTVERTFEERF